jgi:hypothetical protein
MSKLTKMRSDDPARNGTSTQVMMAAPKAVRQGLSRGRWSRWCRLRSPLTARSIQGHA